MVSLFRIVIVLGAQPFSQSTELSDIIMNVEFLSGTDVGVLIVVLRSIINIWNAKAQTTLEMSSLKVARWQNLIPSIPWIAPGLRAGGATQ